MHEQIKNRVDIIKGILREKRVICITGDDSETKSNIERRLLFNNYNIIEEYLSNNTNSFTKSMISMNLNDLCLKSQ